MKLNVGCGDRKMYGFVNIDIRDDLQPDVVCDVSKIHEKFSNVDLIYACHVLEHFPNKPSIFCKTTWKDALEDWYAALRPGGKVRLSVPDLAASFSMYQETGDLSAINAFLFGGQKYDFDYHYSGWDFAALKRDLITIGFSDVKRYDWRKTEHFYVDDYSQAYLPHMDKVNGRLMSLNVEAIK